MKIAVIGAGPAGLVTARNAIHLGLTVVLFEKLSRIGGIWNPDSGGAYHSARMQNSRETFHYSTFPGHCQDVFPGVEQVGTYLSDMAQSEGVMSAVRLKTEVTALEKTPQGWKVTSIHEECSNCEIFDKVIITTGELWQSRKLDIPGIEHFAGQILTSRDYQRPESFEGKKVLVIGGGVSGSDIASDLVPYAQSVALSIRKMGLYLPRQFVTGTNDMMHSYLGRYLIGKMNYSLYLEYLEEVLPDYMRLYRSSGLLPHQANNNAIHINEKIIPNVVSEQIKIMPLVERILADGQAEFVSTTKEAYDVIISCTGYEMPDYSFIEGFDRRKLYEHFFWADDPTLSVINPPVDSVGFGAAFPYFDIISQWVLGVFTEKIELPSAEAMQKWCSEHMQHLHVKRFYDSWLETIRIGLKAGVLPDPSKEFTRYWNLISSVVRPAYLSVTPEKPEPGKMDGVFDFESTRIKILAGLENESLMYLLNKGDISEVEYRAALATEEKDIIEASLPYSQVYL